MSAKEFVDAIHNKKNLDAEDAFKMAMSSKVGDALEAVSYTHLTLPTSHNV